MPWLIILLLLYYLNTHTYPDSSSVPQSLYFTRIYKIVEELNNLEITNSYCTSSIPTLGSVLFNLRFKLLLFKLLFTTLYHCRRHQDLLSCYAQIQKWCWNVELHFALVLSLCNQYFINLFIVLIYTGSFILLPYSCCLHDKTIIELKILRPLFQNIKIWNSDWPIRFIISPCVNHYRN